MSRFSENNSKPEGTPIHGTFRCQTCDKEADEAVFFPQTGAIAWACEDGHKNLIESFGSGG